MGYFDFLLDDTSVRPANEAGLAVGGAFTAASPAAFARVTKPKTPPYRKEDPEYERNQLHDQSLRDEALARSRLLEKLPAIDTRLTSEEILDTLGPKLQTGGPEGTRYVDAELSKIVADLNDAVNRQKQYGVKEAPKGGTFLSSESGEAINKEIASRQKAIQQKTRLGIPLDQGENETLQNLIKTQGSVPVIKPVPKVESPTLKSVMDSRGLTEHLSNAVTHIMDQLKKAGVDPRQPVNDVPGMYLQIAKVVKEYGIIKQLNDFYTKQTATDTTTNKPNTGGGGNPMDEQELPETKNRRMIEEKYMTALQSVMKGPELKGFWNVAIFFLTSLVMGVKNASMLFFHKQQDGSLKRELDFYSHRLDFAERAEEAAKNRQERARLVGVNQSIREGRDQQNRQDKWAQFYLNAKFRQERAIAQAATQEQKMQLQMLSNAFSHKMSVLRFKEGQAEEIFVKPMQPVPDQLQKEINGLTQDVYKLDALFNQQSGVSLAPAGNR